MSPYRQAWLLLRLALQRRRNIFGWAFLPKRLSNALTRGGTARHSTLGLLGAAWAVIIWLAVSAHFAVHGSFLMDECSSFSTIFLTKTCSGAFPVLSLWALLLLIAAVFFELTTQNLARSDWDIEWLVTLPLSARTLLYARIVQGALSSQAGWLVLVPFTTGLAWDAGYHLWAPLPGLLAAVPLLLIFSSLTLLSEAGLRIRCRPGTIRTIQGVCGLLLLPLMLLIASPLLLTHGRTAVLQSIPEQAGWLPTSWPVLSLLAPDMGRALLSWAVAMVWALALVVAAVECMRRLLRRGVMVSGVMDSSRTVKRSWAPALFTAVQRREVLLVSRDRHFFMQTFVAPVLAISIQLWLNPHILSGLFSSEGNVGAVAFGLACYCVLPAISQTMMREGPAIWLLYTFPQSIPRLLLQKALPWTMLAQFYGLGIMLLGARALGFSAHWLWTAWLVAVGIVIYAITVLCLGVQGTDPLQEKIQRRMRLTYIYLDLILSVAYTAAIQASIWWIQVQMVFFCGLFALAMWQKMVDRLPHYLDPSPRSGTPISLSDGLVAAQSFFLLQIAFAMMAVRWLSLEPRTALAFSFFGAGATTWSISMLLLWRNACPNIPKILPVKLVGATVEGVLAGLAGAACAYAYCQAVGLEPTALPISLALAAVLGAPLFEEFIFRGLIFAGLARQMPGFHAVLVSALIFALLHPPESVVPVFGMGVAAALLFWRHGALWPAMLAHAVYNLTVMGFR